MVMKQSQRVKEQCQNSLGLHESIEFAMMIAGHTKFAPDWHFGIWKVRWRSSDAETLQDVANTVTRSSKKRHNIPQLVADPLRPVAFYKWREFLSQFFRPLKNIRKYHHMSVNANEPGIVTCKVTVSSQKQKFNLLKKMPTEDDGMPMLIDPPGLDLSRQWYLFDHISDFFRSDKARDSVCPKPLLPKSAIQDKPRSITEGSKMVVEMWKKAQKFTFELDFNIQKNSVVLDQLCSQI